MTCAKIAAQVVFEAFQRNDFSAAFLRDYQKQCKEKLGLDMNFMLIIRKMLDKMPDEKLDSAISFLSRTGIEKALQDVGDFDFQRQTMIRALRYPQTWTSLVYSLLLYLF
jgi:flavin-dependent dehydrogenase